MFDASERETTYTHSHKYTLVNKSTEHTTKQTNKTQNQNKQNIYQILE